VRIVEEAHVEHQVGERRHAAGKAEAGDGDGHRPGALSAELLADALLQVVAGEIGGVDQHVGPAAQRLEQLALGGDAVLAPACPAPGNGGGGFR
jgi:hypothetical protein